MTPAPHADSRLSEDSPAYDLAEFDEIANAGSEIETHRNAMGEAASRRSSAVRALLNAGITRAEIARRLDVHPNYVNQLAKER